MPAKNTSETSSVMPGSVTKSMLNSPTSSENRTTTDLPTVSKSDISDVFGNQSSSKQENSSTKMTPKKAVELVLEKNKILKEKEVLLENKEKELKNREELVIQVEKDAKAKIDKINGEINELNKIKSELESTIGKLKDEKKSLDNSLSEIELSLDSVNKLQNTESENNTNSILKKIFG
jgi:chromosome segregation ATPase